MNAEVCSRLILSLAPHIHLRNLKLVYFSQFSEIVVIVVCFRVDAAWVESLYLLNAFFNKSGNPSIDPITFHWRGHIHVLTCTSEYIQYATASFLPAPCLPACTLLARLHPAGALEGQQIEGCP